jgi:signal peptidase
MTTTTTTATTQDRPRTRVLHRVRAVLLTLAAVAGSICIVLVILAVTFHITLIMFRTGSMAPEIPTGSLAVVKQIPAAEAHIGQVVTVNRPGQLPITHRIISTTPVAGGGAVLRLKGDANPEPDAVSYTVSTVRLVIWSAPRLAYVIVWLSQPVVIGALTLAVAALITWSLWPDRRPEPTTPALQDTSEGQE